MAIAMFSTCHGQIAQECSQAIILRPGDTGKPTSHKKKCRENRDNTYIGRRGSAMAGTRQQKIPDAPREWRLLQPLSRGQHNVGYHARRIGNTIASPIGKEDSRIRGIDNAILVQIA